MIRNIIFDYGGVIIDLDYGKTQAAFEKLGVKHFPELFTQLRQIDLFDQLDRGDISEEEFRNRLRKVSGLNLSNEQIDEAWNAMIIGIQKEKLQLLEEVKASGFQTFLLSNTNTIHLRYISQYLLREYRMANLDGYFDRVYYSCHTGLRKPDPAIFQLVLAENRLQASQSLFVDDSPQHVEAARLLGMQTIWLRKEADLADALKKFRFKGAG